ncbi:MAG: tetratricopeptide repeat protein [Chitinivibrionales bacterium]|nr:tetratricopeptide repeat protein [Chitinivibrionales bacterium]
METTPLELYETAYRFHYNENRLADAIAYYQRLIKEFPNSNECGYAVIQLQKIKAHDVAENLQATVSSHAPNPFFIPLTAISLLLIFLAFGALGFSYRILNKKIALEQKRLSLAINALGKISRGENDEALKLLSELKKLYTGNIIPWELSADVYRKKRLFEEARKEYETFFQLNPNRKPVESELKFMRFKEKPVMENRIIPPPLKQSVSRPTPPAPNPKGKKRLLRSRSKLTKPPPPSPPKKQKSGLFLVDPDSISYF